MNIQTDIETNNIIKDIETNIANDIKIHIIKDTQDIDFTFNYNEIDNKKMKVLVLKNNEAIFEDLCKIPINKEYIPKEKIIEKQTELQKVKQREEIKLYKLYGEYVYELFSIIIHCKSIRGDHFFAYIKSFEDSK